MEVTQLAILGWRFIGALSVINYSLLLASVVLSFTTRFSNPDIWQTLEPIIGIVIGLLIYKKSDALGEFIAADVGEKSQV